MGIMIDSLQKTQTDVREVVARAESSNLAVARLKARILKDSPASEVITSYDRMHHKHNRS